MSFKFKQFTVTDECCAHKVGTDGVLLGAWAELIGAHRILDIGTGSGLIALMAAQRTQQAIVTGIDTDTPSVEQALKNVAASPFAHRVNIVQADVQEFQATPYDHIICNPPYHSESLLPPDSRRAAARHTHALTLSTLISHAARLLTVNGMFHLILPTTAQAEVATASTAQGMHLVRLTLVRTTATKPPKRMLMSWQRTDMPLPLNRSELILTDSDGHRTPEHDALTHDFYLW